MEFFLKTHTELLKRKAPVCETENKLHGVHGSADTTEEKISKLEGTARETAQGKGDFKKWTKHC